MGQRARKCAFCDRESVTKGGEHLWDDWLNEELPKKTRFNAKKRLSLDFSPIQFVSSGLNEKVPAVCGECNAGWMSALTAKVKERFSATILEGAPFSLAGEDARILAAFTLMKAMVKNYGYPNDDEPFFTRASCERLRVSLTIPSHVKMWFAAFQGTSRYSFHSNFYIVSTSEPGPLEGMEFFCYTYVLGNLALQLLAPRWKYVGHRDWPLVSLIPNRCWDLAAIQFWPLPDQAPLWPPEKYIGDRTFDQFIYRFAAQINLRG